MKKQKSKIFEQDQTKLTDLPQDVSVQILNRLEYKDQLSLGLTTQSNYKIIYEFLKKIYTEKKERPISEEKANKHGITYYQIHYSVNSKKCVHCGCNENKKRQVYFISMIQTCVCSQCIRQKQEYKCIVKTQAKKEWYLDDKDLANLDSFQKKGIGYYMHLYFITEIKQKAYEKYGGEEKFTEYREQRVQKYIQRRNKIEENRDQKSDRESTVQKYYNVECYKYIKLENIKEIQQIKKYTKSNVPKNEQKRLKIFKEVKEKLDKIERYQDTQINQQYKTIESYNINEEPQRRDLVIQLLSIYGLNLREDSKLCRMFIEDHPKLNKNIYEIIEIMRRKDFFYRKTLYPEYQDDYYSWCHLTEQQCEQKALQQWANNNQEEVNDLPYTIQIEMLQYKNV